MVCVPFGTIAEFHDHSYGPAVSDGPTILPSARNSTLPTPMLSDAVATSDTIPLTVLPVGLASARVGASWSLVTCTSTLADASCPAASRAIAVSVCAPSVSPSVFHDQPYGGARIGAPVATPSTRNCTLATPTLSLADARIDMEPISVSPLPGLVKATVGGAVSFATTTVTLVAVSWPA